MRLRYILLASLLISFFSSSLLAASENNAAGISDKFYNVNGVVIDKISREPVPFATVSIWKGNKYSTTDTLGRFSISGIPAGTYRVQVDILGYNQYI